MSRVVFIRRERHSLDASLSYALGGSGSSTQSHWVSSPGGCLITAIEQPFADRNGSHCGRTPGAGSRRVIIGWERSYPSSSSSCQVSTSKP